METEDEVDAFIQEVYDSKKGGFRVTSEKVGNPPTYIPIQMFTSCLVEIYKKD